MAIDFTKYSAPNNSSTTSDFSKYGTPVSNDGVAKPGGVSLVSNPLKDIVSSGNRVREAITGQGEFQGKNSVERGFRAAETAALAIPTAVADVIPGGRAALETVSKGFGAGINFFGNSANLLADAAQKVGLMTADQRKLYDENNTAFAGSPLGIAIESGASIGEASGNISNVILMAHGVAEATQRAVDVTKSAPVKTATDAADLHLKTAQMIADNTPDAKPGAIIANTQKELVAGLRAEGFNTQSTAISALDPSKFSTLADFAKQVKIITNQSVPPLVRPLEIKAADPILTRQKEVVSKTVSELQALENRYSDARRANDYSKDGGAASRERIAQSGVLKYTIDENGVIRTKETGGAADQYRAMTTGPAESVVRDALVREGNKVNLSEIKLALEREIASSGLTGADRISALNYIEREIEGLRLDADAKGYILLEKVHDAKINTTKNINYQTPPETATTRKAVARAYKTLVENNSDFNVREVNLELAKFYDDAARIELLDGKRVSGGKLGKYTAQISGNIVGGALGSFLGPFGVSIGAIGGGEVASFIKSKTMQNTFNNGSTPVKPSSPVLDAAVLEVSKPQLQLPPGNSSAPRSTIESGPTINLPAQGNSNLRTTLP